MESMGQLGLRDPETVPLRHLRPESPEGPAGKAQRHQRPCHGSHTFWRGEGSLRNSSVRQEQQRQELKGGQRGKLLRGFTVQSRPGADKPLQGTERGCHRGKRSPSGAGVGKS